jgi:predicted dehydrogenase
VTSLPGTDARRRRGGARRAKVGIIGCGSVADHHLNALTTLPVEIVGLCDVDEQQAGRTASAFGLRRTFGQAADLLERERPDVAHVLTPPQSHRELSVLAMESGCDVLVEKPMAMDLSEADEMVEASRRTGRTLGVCHTHLFNPPVLEARALTANGRLGTVVGVDVGFTVHGGVRDRYLARGWVNDLPGGVVHELAAHPVYLLREFLGTLSLASAVWKPIAALPPGAVEFRAVFEGESGLGIAAISASGKPMQSALRIHGTGMTVSIDLRGRTVLKTSRPSGSGPPMRRARTNLNLAGQVASQTVATTLRELRRPWHRGHPVLIRGFYEAIRDGRPPPVTADDGRAVVGLLDGLWATRR